MSELIEKTQVSVREELSRLAGIEKDLEGRLLETLSVMLQVDPEMPIYINEAPWGNYVDFEQEALDLRSMMVYVRDLFSGRYLPDELQEDLVTMLSINCTSLETDEDYLNRHRAVLVAGRHACHLILALRDLSTRAAELLVDPEFSNDEVSFNAQAGYILEYLDDLMPTK